MALSLNKLGKKKKAKIRVGRGNASGHGTYSGRGIKGQRARSGGKKGLKFKGFKRTLMSIPKMKGMRSLRLKPQIVKLSALAKHFADDAKINVGTLLAEKIIRDKKRPVKIVADKEKIELKTKLEIFGCLLTKTAAETVEKAGGKIIGNENGEPKAK